MINRGAAGPSQRQLRVGEEIRHALAWILERGEIRDPAVSGLPVTVTEVRISPDLKNATAFVLPLGGGDPADHDQVLGGLERAVPFLRRRIAKSVRLKYVPRLSFIWDTSFDEAGRIDALLHEPRVLQDLVKDGDETDDGA